VSIFLVKALRSHLVIC